MTKVTKSITRVLSANPHRYSVVIRPDQHFIMSTDVLEPGESTYLYQMGVITNTGNTKIFLDRKLQNIWSDKENGKLTINSVGGCKDATAGGDTVSVRGRGGVDDLQADSGTPREKDQ